MSNRFYQFVNQLISGSVAKSAEVNAQFQGVDTGFDTVEGEVNRAIKLPDAESATDQVITNVPSARQGYFVGFDLSGNLRVGNSFLIDWDMASHRLRNLVSPVATDEPVTLGYLNAYSTGLVTGMPTIVGQNGPLTTNGTTVIWDSANRLLPSTASAQASSSIIYTSGQVKWALVKHNLAIDPNGAQGSAYWATSLNNIEDQTGYKWTNSAPLVAATFDHKPASGVYITCGANQPIVASVSIDTTGWTLGTLAVVFRYYDAGSSLLSESAPTSVTVPTAETRYTLAVTTPASTVKVVAVVKFTGVSAGAGGIVVRDLKVESGADPTPFNDDKTYSIQGAAKAVNPIGYGFVSPELDIGDATATTSRINFRSQTGAQAYDVLIGSAGGTNGTVGKGALTIASKTMTNTGPIGYSAEYNAGNTGAAITIDFAANGSRQKTTMNSATPAITFSTAGLIVGHYQLKIVQDGSGGRVPSFVGFGAGDCVGNAFPVVASAINGVTFFNLYWDGAQFWVSGNAWD